jgi:hypothetical protein
MMVRQRWILQAATGGIVAALAYDLYRLPFVLNGAPLFKVFPRFGEMILGAGHPAMHVMGWAYHFLNGAALGIMLVAAVPQRRLFLGGICWALLVEALLLLTPYADFFGLKKDARFLFLTASAHLIFGIVLGWWCKRFVVRKAAESQAVALPTAGSALPRPLAFW